MVDPVNNKVTPDLKATYKDEFARGVKLFQDSLGEYQKADEMNKKAKFKDVMDKALVIMNQAARGFITSSSEKEKAEAFKGKMMEDYQNFIASGDSDAYSKLQSDVNTLKRFT
ncbi:MAG: hypothetical protein JSR76_07970 [Verrucomicrobia bacterium]|nr:hypothetical protein [Verrucomicrobiota bacterium]